MDELSMTVPAGLDLVTSPPTIAPPSGSFSGVPAAVRKTGTLTNFGGTMNLGGGLMSSTGESGTAPGEVLRRKQMQELKNDLELLRAKLGRRNLLMKELIKAYHADIITIKEELCRKETSVIEKKYIPSTEVHDHIPSVDLREFLKLFAPTENYIRVKPCDMCGGSIEIMHHESERVIELEKKCGELQERTNESETLIAGYRAEALRDRKVLEEERFRMALDRQIFEERVLELKSELSKYEPKEIAQLRRDVVLYRGQTKDLSSKLRGMATLEADLRKSTADYQSLQDTLQEKENMLRDIERDKCMTEELAASLGRKCESLEQEVERSAAAVQDSQRKCKAATDQMNQLKESNSKLQKVLQDSRRTEQAARARLTEVETQFQEMARQHTELETKLAQAETKLEEKADEFAVIRAEVSERRRSRAVIPSIQVFAANTDEFGEALSLRSIPSQVANVSAVPHTPNKGPGDQAPTEGGSTGGGVPTSLVYVVSLPKELLPNKLSRGDSSSQPHGDASVGGESSAMSSPSSSPRRGTHSAAPTAPSQPPVATTNNGVAHHSDDDDDSRHDNASQPTQSGIVSSVISVTSVGSLDSAGSETRLQGAGKMELWIEVSSSSSDESTDGNSIKDALNRKISFIDDEKTELKEMLKVASEQVIKLEGELHEEISTRKLIERSFIRATSKRFYSSEIEDDFFALPSVPASVIVEETGTGTTSSTDAGPQSVSPTKRALGSRSGSSGGGGSSPDMIKDEFIAVVRGVFERQKQDVSLVRDAPVQNADVQKLMEENETLVAKLVRAVREKDLAQEALAKVNQQAKSAQTGNEQHASEPPAAVVGVNVNAAAEVNAPEAGGKVVTVTQVEAKQAETLRHQVSQLESKYVETRMKHEERVKHLDDKILRLKTHLIEEKEKVAKATKELEQERATHQATNDKLAKEVAKVATLREGLKDQLEEIKKLGVRINELTVEFNFKLARKDEDIEAVKKDMRKEAAKADRFKVNLGGLMTCMFKVCKCLEESLEKRVSSSELKGLDPKVSSDLASKQISRRCDKKELFKEEEMLTLLTGAKVLENPLSYMAARLMWTLANVTNDVTNSRTQRKELHTQVDEANRTIAKLEKKIKELTRSMEEQKELYERKMAAKQAEVNELKDNITQMRDKEAKMEVELDRLRSVEQLFERLKVAMADMTEQKQLTEVALNKNIIQRDEYKTDLDATAQALEEKKAELSKSVEDYQALSRVLLTTQDTLASTESDLGKAKEIIREEEIRRANRHSVSTQFNPEVTSSEVQTTFFVPDMSLRHAVALQESQGNNKLFVDRVVTPTVTLNPVPRRCSTAVGTRGQAIVTGPAVGEEGDNARWQDLQELGLKAGVARAMMPCSQPMGSLRSEMKDFMMPMLKQGRPGRPSVPRRGRLSPIQVI